jgi:hypothetical protein
VEFAGRAPREAEETRLAALVKLRLHGDLLAAGERGLGAAETLRAVAPVVEDLEGGVGLVEAGWNDAFAGGWR